MDSVSAPPTPTPGLSDTEPPHERRRQIKEQINVNIEKLYQDAKELYKRRLQDARTDDERSRLKEDHKLEMGRIRALGTEEYHTQLELERQQRKWALGQPIDEKWKDALMRERRGIFEGYRPPEPTPDVQDQNGPQSSRSNPPTAKARSNPSQRFMTAPEHNPPPLFPGIEQKRVSHASDAIAGPTKVSEDDRPSTRASQRPTRSETERYTPARYEIWRPNVTVEEDAAGARRGSARRGSTPSQPSVGLNNIRSHTTEPIPERPDDYERETIPRKPEREQLSERQPRRAFEIATEFTEGWDDPPYSSAKIVPNSAPPGRGRDRTKPTDGGRPPRPSSESPRSSYEVDTPPSSHSPQAHPMHNFGGRETNDHDHVPESETERIRLRLEELRGLEFEREETVKRAEAERMVREKIEEIKMKEEETRRKVEEARRMEEEARRREEVARKQEKEARRRQEEAMRWEEEAKRQEEEVRRLKEEVRRKEEDVRRREEDTKRKEEEVRRKEEEAMVKEEEARIKEEEARRKEDEVKKKELDARRKEGEARKKEQEAKRKEQEAKRMEEEARRIEEEARRREEETKRREEDLERREEEVHKKEQEASFATNRSTTTTDDYDVGHHHPPTGYPGEGYCARYGDLGVSTGDPRHVLTDEHEEQLVTLRATYERRRENMDIPDDTSQNFHTKTYTRNVQAWRSLSHHRIHPLLGLFEVESRVFLVLPVMINWTLTEWRKRQAPNVAQIHKLMREVAEGLHYIHSKGIVHGDLRGENVLLDSNFHCQITGFGLTRRSAGSASLMLKFAAPELISDRGWPSLESCYEYHEIQERKTMQTDMYAFGCLYYAIFFDTVPFQDIEQEQIRQLVEGGKRPARLNTPRMNDDIWKMIQDCWNHDPAERPTMEQITLTFTAISALSLLLTTLSDLKAHSSPLVNEDTLRYICGLLRLPEHFIIQVASEQDCSNVKLLLDFILFLLHGGNLMHCGIQNANKTARKLMLKLISTATIPESLSLTGVEIDLEPVGIGGFGRVFGGKHEGQRVAVKLLDKSHRKRGSLSQDFCREALAWRSLSHRFILPLLGIFEGNSQLYLVSPLMANGTLSDWRKEQKPSISEICRVMLEVAEGLQYIHLEGIIHGDLHGGNVLLDSDLHCQITDFGSTRHSEATITQSTTALSVSFAAPELFGMCIKCGNFDCEGCYEGHGEQHRSKTMNTDIYAFGCLYYAIFFDIVPFHGTNELQIFRLLAKGRRPNRLEDPKMADNTWNLIQDCWKSIPSERPEMERIMKILTP